MIVLRIQHPRRPRIGRPRTATASTALCLMSLTMALGLTVSGAQASMSTRGSLHFSAHAMPGTTCTATPRMTRNVCRARRTPTRATRQQSAASAHATRVFSAICPTLPRNAQRVLNTAPRLPTRRRLMAVSATMDSLAALARRSTVCCVRRTRQLGRQTAALAMPASTR